MSKLKRRRQAASRAAYVRSFEPGHPCPNCGELTVDGHYAPPALGDPGFFACAATRGGMKDTVVTSVRRVDGGLEMTMDSRDPRLRWDLDSAMVSFADREIGFIKSVDLAPTDTSVEVIDRIITGVMPVENIPGRVCSWFRPS